MKKLKLFLTLLVLVTCSMGLWADPVVLFHESFGSGSTSGTQTWSHANGNQTGVEAVMANAGLTSSATNAKQSKQSTGNNYSGVAGASLMGNQGSTSGEVVATYVVGPLVTTNCSDMVVSFAVKYGSVADSYYSNLYYSTDNSSWTAVTTTGGPTTANNWGVKTSTSTIPASSTIWFKIEYSLGKKGGNPYIDEFDLSGVYAVSTTPSVSADPESVEFGTVKQYTTTDESYWVLEDVKITGENLTDDVVITSNFTSVFNIVDPTKAAGVAASLTITPKDGAIDTTITISASTYSSGVIEKTITVSSAKETPEFTALNIPVSITLTETFSVSVVVNDDEMGTATVNGVASVYADDETDLVLLAEAKPGYEFVNWTFSDPDNIVKNDGDENKASITVLAAADQTITANFQAQSCTGLPAPTYRGDWITYQSLNVSWYEVENAESYLVTLKQGETVIVENESVTTYSFLKAGLEAKTTYTLIVMAVGDGTTYCAENNPVLEKSFTTSDYPAATLTLSEIGYERTLAGEHKVKDVVTLPTTAEVNAYGKVFVGWRTNSWNVTPEYAPGAEYTLNNEANVLYAVYATETPGTTTTATDNLTNSLIGISGTSYDYWSGKTSNSDAVYAGNSAGGNEAIQLRSKENAGIVTTTSGGKAKKVTLTWNSNTAATRTVDIYGKNTAYSSSADLYGENPGTLLGSLNIDNAKEGVSELTIPDSAFIGLRSNSSALYLDNIAIEWSKTSASTYSNYTTSGARYFASLEELVAADVPDDKDVVVSFSNLTITDTWGKTGAWINVQDKYSHDIEFAANSAEHEAVWNLGGQISGTNIAGKWRTNTDESFIFLDSWDGFTYIAPTTLEWSATEATVVKDADDNVFPLLTKTPEALEGVTFSSSNADAATIDENTGEITLVAAGTTTITAKFAGNENYLASEASYTLTVKEPAGLAWSAATGKAYTVGNAASVPSLTNPNSLTVTYTSTDKTVATIDGDGVIDPLKAGTTTIKASFAGNDTYVAAEVEYTLTVYAPTSIVITGEATKTEYDADETFSFAGLGAKAIFTDDTEYEIPAAEIAWKAAPEVISANGNVEVTATWKGLTSAVKNIDVTVMIVCSNLPATTGIASSYITDHSISVSWKAVENAESYLVTLKQGENVIVENQSVTGTQFVKIELQPATTYTLSVMAVGNGVEYCEDGNDVWEQNFTTNAKPTVTFEQPEHGTLVVKHGDDIIESGATVEDGWWLTVEATPADGYKLLSIMAGETDITEAKQFQVGQSDVTISAAFEEKPLPVVGLAGTFNNWDASKALFVPATDKQSASVTITLEAGVDSLKIVSDGNWLTQYGLGGLYRIKRDWPKVEPANVVNVGGNNIVIDVDMNGDYTFTWNYADSTLFVTYPELPEKKFYLRGSFNNWAWDIQMVNDEGVWSASVVLEAATDYQFKIARVQLGESHFGAKDADNHMYYGNSTNWELTSILGGNNINLTTTTEASYTFYFIEEGAKLDVVIPEAPTGVDELNAADKAVKSLENGLLIIRRGDKSYNAQGQLIK